MTNLQNIEGFPVYAFRTDTWSSPTYIDGPDMAPTAVEETKIGSISIYPNPCTDRIQISGLMSGFKRIELFDMIGRKVKSLCLNESSNSTVDISDLQSGAYSLKIYQNNLCYTCLKVLKK